MKSILFRVATMAAAAVLVSVPAHAAKSAEERSLSELRNTVVNLLQGLVERGVLTREQAEGMVAAAQAKAAEEAAAQATLEKEESGAVRVPYVPEIVRDEIRKQVVADLTAEVTKEVVDQAKSEDWGVPGALPEWLTRVRWSGDVRVRTQGDVYAEDNIPNLYIDPLTVNDRGGISRAGLAAFANVTEDRQRLRVRARLGLDAELGWGWTFATRLTTGNLRDPVSTNQTLGNTAARYQTGLDLAYLKWYGNSDTGAHVLNFMAGRMPNPWQSTDLVWDGDLTFEGVAANYRYGLGSGDPYSHFAYVTLGAFPIEEVELSSKDKWLLGAQIGLDWKLGTGSRIRLGTAYYDFRNITGRRNIPDDTRFDFTSPKFMQRGNTLFDIRNDADPTTNLFALAAEYRLLNANAAFDWKLNETQRMTFSADYVKNIGYDQAKVRTLTGLSIEPGDQGYQAEIGFGSSSMAAHGAWRAFVGYRYLERDAVLDAFTDSDFRLGGTDSKGYYIGTDYAFTPRVSARLRYLTGNEVADDSPPLGIDVLQFDVNAQF